MFRNSEILIFDEPTVSLDAKTQGLSFHRVSFMVSHRLSQTTMADKILFIKDACTHEQSDHAKLMNEKFEYAKMFCRQVENYIAK